MFLKSQHKVLVIFLAEKERTTTKVCFSHNGTPKLGLLQVKPSKDSRDAVCCDGTGIVLCILCVEAGQPARLRDRLVRWLD